MKETVQTARLRNQMASDEALHSSNNAFIKSAQLKQAAYAGKDPQTMGEECYRYNAHMTNTGETAADFARGLTAGLDKTAYPVK
jgi:hypothetical protein